MTFTAYIERALAGCCVICDRRLPKRKIALYTALVNTWRRGMPRTEKRDVEVAVCGEKCRTRYDDGEIPS